MTSAMTRPSDPGLELRIRLPVEGRLAIIENINVDHDDSIGDGDCEYSRDAIAVLPALYLESDVLHVGRFLLVSSLQSRRC